MQPSKSGSRLGGRTERGSSVSVTPDQILNGNVVRLHDFGAFVELEPEVTGLVHISEVHRDFVENIHAYLTEEQDVTVRVMAIKEDGRIDLSIKRAEPDWEDEAQRRQTT